MSLSNATLRDCALILLLSSVFLIDPNASTKVIDYETWQNLAFLKHRDVLFTMADSSDIILHEGLPRGGQWLQKELETQSINKIADFPFYSKTIELSDADKTWLQVFFQAPSHMSPFSGHKACGGFHPDYCVEWTAQNRRYYCLICFGCHEGMIMMQEFSFRCDLGTEESIHQLFNFLFQHRLSRPLSGDLQEMINRYKKAPVTR